MLNEDLSFKYLIKEPQSKKSKSPLLILLHGFGSNESRELTKKEVSSLNKLIDNE